VSNYDTYSPVAIAAAQQYGVPVNVFLAQITQESDWNPNETSSSSSATGIAQFIAGTAAEFGIDPTDPVQSLYAAAKYDAQLYNRTGSWTAALQSYGTLSASNPNQGVAVQQAISAYNSGNTGGTSVSTGTTSVQMPTSVDSIPAISTDIANPAPYTDTYTGTSSANGLASVDATTATPNNGYNWLDNIGINGISGNQINSIANDATGTQAQNAIGQITQSQTGVNPQQAVNGLASDADAVLKNIEAWFSRFALAVVAIIMILGAFMIYISEMKGRNNGS
jgi:hypothetical protein